MNIVAVVESGRETRHSKTAANKKIAVINEDSEVEELEEDDSKNANNRRNVSKTNINLTKQYEKYVECGNRQLFRIHDPKTNKSDSGSKNDDPLKYVEFKAGLYVALGRHMMKTLKEKYNASVTEEPIEETMGDKGKEAVTRVMSEISVDLKGQTYRLKVKVYPTKCSMDFLPLGPNPEYIKEELDNKTVSGYFVDNVLPDIVRTITSDSSVDIEKLNNEWVQLATAGLEAGKTTDVEDITDKDKEKCVVCDHAKSNKKTLKCKDCSSLVHFDCELNKDKYKTKQQAAAYYCFPCLRGEAVENNSKEGSNEKQIVALKTPDGAGEVRTDDEVGKKSGENAEEDDEIKDLRIKVKDHLNAKIEIEMLLTKCKKGNKLDLKAKEESEVKTD